MKNPRQSYIYAIITVLLWSTVPTAFKTGLNEIPLLPFLTIASGTSMMVLFTILVFGGKISSVKKSTGRDIINSAVLGFINPFLYYLILFKAYQLLPAQVAQPLNMIWPIILVFLSVPLLGQKIKSKSFIALIISFAGVYVISSQGELFNTGKSDIKGVLLATGSSIFWAFYFILNVRDKRDEAVKLFLNFLFGSAYLIIALVITGGLNMPEVNLKGIAASVYVGIFEMGISFLFWLRALQLASSTDKVSNLAYISPLLSLVFVHFILKEPVYYTTLLGLILIITGIWIQSHNPQRA